MELPFNLGQCLKDEPVTRIDRETIRWINFRDNPGVQKAIDEMGVLSAKDRGMQSPITSFEKLANCDDDQAIYLLWKPDKRNLLHSIVIGYLKSNVRSMHLNGRNGKSYFCSPVIILDFFVHPNYQCQGYGLKLFKALIDREAIENVVERCVFDNPTISLVKFLNKHFGVYGPFRQPTNMVTFSGFFDKLISSPTTSENGEFLQSHQHSRLTFSSDGTLPSSNKIPRASEHDSVGDLIHCGEQKKDTRESALPDTPQERKFQRDFGHQNIW